MLHLNQSFVLKSSLDLFIAGIQERPRNLPQGYQLRIIDILAFVLGEREQEDRSMRVEPNKHAKAASLAFSWSRNALF
jgi:hypothetical protein